LNIESTTLFDLKTEQLHADCNQSSNLIRAKPRHPKPKILRYSYINTGFDEVVKLYINEPMTVKKNELVLMFSR